MGARRDLVAKFTLLRPGSNDPQSRRFIDGLDTLAEHYLVEGIQESMVKTDSSYEEYCLYVSGLLDKYEGGVKASLTAMVLTKFAKSCHEKIQERRRITNSLARLAEAINNMPKAYSQAVAAEHAKRNKNKKPRNDEDE